MKYSKEDIRFYIPFLAEILNAGKIKLDVWYYAFDNNSSQFQWDVNNTILKSLNKESFLKIGMSKPYSKKEHKSS